MNVTILGNNSALPAFGRHPTAQVAEVNGETILIDCGEGTQIQMQRFGVRWRRLNNILISHLHGDHYFGLPGLLNSMSLQGRTEELHLHVPAGLLPILDAIMVAGDHEAGFPLRFHPLPEGAALLADTSSFSISCFPVSHRVPCHGFVIEQKSSGRQLLLDKCEEYSIPRTFFGNLKRGADHNAPDGTVIANSSVTCDALPAKRYAYTADTLFSEAYLPYIEGADMLYHESTYLHADAAKAIARHHSTSVQAAEMAKMANVGKLLLGHFSSKYKDIAEFAIEAASIFPNVEVTTEGATYTI